MGAGELCGVWWWVEEGIAEGDGESANVGRGKRSGREGGRERETEWLHLE